MSAILAIIAQGEGETLEFKKSFSSDVIESAVAFANTRGGKILLGVSDDGKICGVNPGKELLRDYINRIATATEPSLMVDAEQYQINSKLLIILSVSEFPIKPVAFRGRCFRRAGSCTRVLAAAEIAALHLRSTGQSLDAVIVPDKTRDDIDFALVRDYMRQASLQGRRTFSDTDEPWQVLKKLELVKADDQLTRAAILLFGKNPQSPLMQAVVHAGRLREKIHVMDNRIISGTIIRQVEETLDFVKKNLHVRFEITGAPQRQEIWDYPLEALREAITNAICHRDYGDNADIQIKIFETSLQVWSPGFLPYDITVSELLSPEHSSKPRNKLIAQIFYDLGLIEKYGSGIQRIIKACQTSGLPPPLFENFSGGFRVKFQLPETSGSSSIKEKNISYDVFNVALNDALNDELKQKLLRLINQNPGMQRKFLSQRLHLSERSIDRHLAPLLAAQLVEHRGSKKTGGYFVTT